MAHSGEFLTWNDQATRGGGVGGAFEKSVARDEIKAISAAISGLEKTRPLEGARNSG